MTPYARIRIDGMESEFTMTLSIFRSILHAATGEPISAAALQETRSLLRKLPARRLKA